MSSLVDVVVTCENGHQLTVTTAMDEDGEHFLPPAQYPSCPRCGASWSSANIQPISVEGK